MTLLEAYYPLPDLEGSPLRLRIPFDYSPGTPDVLYLSNGDPGEPGTPEEWDIGDPVLETQVAGQWRALATLPADLFDANFLDSCVTARLDDLADERAAEEYDHARDLEDWNP